MKHQKFNVTAIIISIVVLITACVNFPKSTVDSEPAEYTHGDTNQFYSEVNENVPQFSNDEITTKSFEHYSELDELGRCGTALACVGRDIMPTEKRGAIGSVKPTGWHLVKYDIVDGKYLYNRCHLIGYQLTGENANEKNLITGTRSMNVDGMLPFENAVADYVHETGNHVMYRVTPVFNGTNLLADGVQIEAYSVEDRGKSVSFNVFVFNSQPGIEINYADGSSRLKGDSSKSVTDAKQPKKNGISDNGNSEVYVLNTNTKKFHYASCPSVKNIRPKNRESFNGPVDYLINNGYTACGRCKPNSHSDSRP